MYRLTPELLHKMQEKYPIFILIAAGLWDLSGTSRNEHRGSEVSGLSFPGEAQPGAESSPVPSKVFSVTEDNSDEATFNFQSPAVDPTNEMTADFIPAHTERAERRTAVLPKELAGNLEVPEPHTEAAALKPQDGHTFPSKLLSSMSIPASTPGSQAATHLQQPDRPLQGKPGYAAEAGSSPTSSSAGLPQPFLSGGTHGDSAKFTAVSSIPIIKEMEVPSPKTSLLTSVVSFPPPREEMAASPFPTGVRIALGSAREDRVPTGTPPAGRRSKDTHPQVQPDSKAAVTPAHLEQTQSTDAKATASAPLQTPALGGLDAAHSRTTRASAVPFPPALSLQQEPTDSKARNSTTAAVNGSGHPTQLPVHQTLPQGNVHSSPLLMPLQAPVHGDLLPFQGPISTTEGQRPLSLPRTLSCTKHVSQETNRSSQETTVLVLQRGADHQTMTSKPEKSRPPESPQASVNPSSSSQSLKLPQTTKELRGVTPALLPGTSTSEKAALRPVSTFESVHAGLRPPGTSSPPYVRLQLMGTPTSAGRGLLTPASSMSAASGSRVQGISAHPEAFPVMLQMSTVEDSKSKKSLPAEISGTVSPPVTPQASPVPSPAPLPDHGNQKDSQQTSAPSASQIQQASASSLPSLHTQGSQSSPAAAHPDPAVPRAPSGTPAHPARAPVQFAPSQHAATRNLSAFRGDQLTVLPSPLHLSFLLTSTNGTVCLQPLQDSPPPAELPHTSVGGLVSIQQILAAANSSALDLADLQNLSPSSLILVKPVFILLPSARPDLQVPFPDGEDDHKTAPLFSDKHHLTLGTPESSRDVPMKTSSSYPTSKSLRPETAPPAASHQRAEKTEVTPQPGVISPNHTAITSAFPAVPSVPNGLVGPGVRVGTAAQATHLHGLPEETQVPAPSSKGTGLLLLKGTLAEPVTPTAPPLVPAQHGHPVTPEGLFTTGKPPSSSVIPLLSAKGLPAFQVPAQPPFPVTGAADQVQHSKELVLQTASHHQGLAAPPVQFVPSTSSAFSALPTGNDHRGSAVGSTACSGGATLHAQTHVASVKPALTKQLGFTPPVLKPFVTTETPPTAPVHAPSPAQGQLKATVTGKLLAMTAHPGMYSSSPASPPSPAPAHLPLPSAMKRDQVHQAPAEVFSQASVGENTKPTEISTRARKIGTGKLLGTSVSLPAISDTRTLQPPTAVLGDKVVFTPMQPSVPAGSGSALEPKPNLTQTTAQPPAAMTSPFAAKNYYTTTSLTSKKPFLLPTGAAPSDPTVLPTIAGVNRSAVVSASEGKSEDVLAKGDAAPTSQLPTQALVPSPHQASAGHPLEKVLLEDDTGREAAPPSPGTVVHAAGPPTARAFSVSADNVTSQSAVSHKAAADGAEMLPARDPVQFPPAPGSPLRSSGGLGAPLPRGSSPPGAAHTGQSGGLLLHTGAEEGFGTSEVTEEAAGGLVTVVAALAPEPSALPSASRRSRVSQPGAAALDGLAVVSDDVCGSGNYTVQLSLRPAAGAGPAPSQDTFLAVMAVQSNSSQPVLRVRSCCVTPSASPGGPGATCCPFPRLPFECRHIQLLQSSKSRAASFTIQLFQMLNHSVAYLHCELSVCLRGTAGCEQDCSGSVEPLLQSDRNSYGTLHNLVSFGPVLRTRNRFLYKPLQGPGSAMLVPILLGSLTGFAVLGSAFISLWLHHRQKTRKPRCPQLGDIHGL